MPRIRSHAAILLLIGLRLAFATYKDQSGSTEEQLRSGHRYHDFSDRKYLHQKPVPPSELRWDRTGDAPRHHFSDTKYDHPRHDPTREPYKVRTDLPFHDPDNGRPKDWRFPKTTTTTTTTTEPPRPYCVMPRRITELSLAKTGLKVLNDSFIRSQDVTALDVSDNQIEETSIGAFRLAPNLEQLVLSRNRLLVKDLLRLGHLPNLQRLTIDENNGTRGHSFEVPSDMLHALPSLLELRLCKNRISGIQLNLREFAPRLSKLYLSGNALTSADFLENAPAGLTHLYLEDNAIKQLDSRTLGNLVELVVPGNRFTEVCRENCGGSSLWLQGPTVLRKLDASRNQVGSITDDAFQDTKSLNHLDLSHNRLESFSNQSASELASLEHLLLGNNKLRSIPNLCHMARLRSLDLNSNSIFDVHGNALCGSVTLKTLLLNNNQIATIESGAMDAPYLDELNLAANLITELPANWLTPRNTLRVLVLSNNRIVDLDKVWWSDVNMQMDLASMRSWNTLANLHLEGNPIPYIRLSTVVRFPPGLKMHFVNVSEAELSDDAAVGNEADDNDDDGAGVDGSLSNDMDGNGFW